MDGWIMAADIDELSENQMIKKTVGQDNIVLLRSGNGVIALQDRCPHRFAPLSLGKVADGLIHCGYHGLRFGTDGRCVFNPHGDGRIPPAAKVTSYEVEQRDRRIFVRLAEPAR
jgi:phenylpropionate dioxygenase-like ring-hydroxylating dioxygenase large terminal subunit